MFITADTKADAARMAEKYNMGDIADARQRAAQAVIAANPGDA